MQATADKWRPNGKVHTRARFEKVRGQLELERSSYWSHWQDLSKFILTRQSRFFPQDANKGYGRDQLIVDNTGTRAAQTLASGMMSGITSPARPWFRLTTQDPDLAENDAVKDWLDLATQREMAILLRSNVYNSLPMVYKGLAVFGTSALSIEEDFDKCVKTQVFPIGSYMVANDDNGKIRVFMRIFVMTVRQIVEKFCEKDDSSGEIDWSHVSKRVRNLWKNGQYEAWVEVVHVILPNEQYDPGRVDAKWKKFRSTYYERGVIPSAGSGTLPSVSSDDDLFLSDKGYDYFPILCPRWEVSSTEDVYGVSSPGIIALGDIKQLQVGERRGLQAVEKMVNPPLVGPSVLRSGKVSILPGDITYLDSPGGQSPALKPVHEVNFDVTALKGWQDAVRERINKAFFVDLWLMLTNDEREQPPTATEIAARKEEKLLMLGPVLEQLNQDLLDPLITITFRLMLRQGRIPPPPPELRGQVLHIEYVSILAQAQKALGISAMDRFSQFCLQLAEVRPDSLDVVDFDEMVKRYAEAVGVPPHIILALPQVAAIRNQRQQAQAAQQKMAMIEQASKSARNLAGSPTDGPNALTELMQQGQAGQLQPTLPSSAA